MKQWEKKVRSASSLDELLRLTDFPDWKLWKCRLRLQQQNSSSSPPVASHRSTRYATESYSPEILKGLINDLKHMLGVCMSDGREHCLPFSHRRRMAADPMHAQRNLRRCSQGAGHGSLYILQAPLCCRPQVCYFASVLVFQQLFWFIFDLQPWSNDIKPKM